MNENDIDDWMKLYVYLKGIYICVCNKFIKINYWFLFKINIYVKVLYNCLMNFEWYFFVLYCRYMYLKYDLLIFEY